MRSVGRLARTSAALAAVSVVLIGAGGLAAWADRLDADADGDALATPHPNGLTVDQNIGTTETYDLSALITETGNATDDVFPGAVDVTIARTGAWLAASPGSPAAFQFTTYAAAQDGTISITVPCTAAPGTSSTATATLTAGVSTNGKSLGSNGSVSLNYNITAVEPIDASCGGGTPNEAPDVEAGGPYEGDEGSSIALDGASAVDDTDAKGDLTYAWEFASQTGAGTCTLNDATSLNGASIKCSDNGDVTVKLTATDTDNASASDTASVTVNNVDPTVSASISESIDCRTNASLNLSFSDPGVEDNPWAVDIDWGDGSDHTTFEAAAQGSQVAQTHEYTSPGTYSPVVTVTDKDGGVGTDDENSITVNQTYSVSFLKPFDASTDGNYVINKAKAGRTVPVKVTVYDDCALRALDGSDAAPVVRVSKATVPNGATTDGVEVYADAGASNSTTDAFRWTDGFWIYNLDTKTLNLTVGQTYRVDVKVEGVLATDDEWGLLATVK